MEKEINAEVETILCTIDKLIKEYDGFYVIPDPQTGVSAVDIAKDIVMLKIRVLIHEYVNPNSILSRDNMED